MNGLRQQQWRQLSNIVLDIFFPPKCVSCGQRGQLLCSACRAGVARVAAPFCPICGRSTSGPRLCDECRRTPPAIDGIRSVVYFEGAIRRAIHHLKYHGIEALAYPLAEFLVEYQVTSQLPADVILAVPLHPHRQRTRGFNQSGLLAQVLGMGIGLAVLEDALERTRETPPQVGLDAVARRSNVAGAFAARKEAVVDRQILLIDDVCTTGATLEACSHALKAQGARSVWGLTLARAR